MSYECPNGHPVADEIVVRCLCCPASVTYVPLAAVLEAKREQVADRLLGPCFVCELRPREVGQILCAECRGWAEVRRRR
jgi:hypothetical protein